MLVNANNKVVGTMDKLAAHRSGMLHRAFSVFIFNNAGELLLQQRAFEKYHSGGLWTNTCCSHPRLGEVTVDAAHRRLKEEMGMWCELTELFQFTYRHEFENSLIEHEYDHVFMGVSNQLPEPDPSEVAGFKYVDTELLALKLVEKPEDYTPWFKLCFDQVMENYQHIKL
ncbi:Isopentenyl-diphosphate Delta-isomerase [Mucilaginibacter paludis DSM 18603]|uniref:Isopentenyl-diphosphate delta-isomerase n=2 Tax=Mucilaginibacter TaxID=423349 RepID=H1YAJ8_9SPHI|nr:Isopentenyl-diphosphate Delta-isomerase [Mucilaginibacter paludis DSM 18603]